MFRNKSVSQHQFSMVPRADIPRSAFHMQKSLKTTFRASYLIPMFCEEVLPGDTFRVKMTAFARLATPIFPFMDNLHYESFFFFVPNRLVWTNWVKFMGEQESPGDSTSYSIPQIVSPEDGYDIGTIYDYFGLPTFGQVTAGETVTHSALPLRAYAQIYNEWFRDQNLVNPLPKHVDDGPDLYTEYSLRRRGKRHDYFTSALPWTQKGTAVTLPLGTTAPVVASSEYAQPIFRAVEDAVSDNLYVDAVGTAPVNDNTVRFAGATLGMDSALGWDQPNLVADLSAATAATINQLRQSFQIQKLLERDARGGSRYTEIVRAHFGVLSPDARLQRPEYLGGGHTPISVSAIPQTSETADTPQGNLAAMGQMVAHGHGFTQSFTEHGYVIGVCMVRADLTYQQGMRRHWSRLTRYDYYFPVFSMLGEQAILNKEIYCQGTAEDDDVFGYQERWAEYRYTPSEITGLFRSTATSTLDAWHLAQHFTSLPVLNVTFIGDRTDEVLPRVLAVNTEEVSSQFLFDAVFDISAARPLPLYSVPGLVDHF